MSKVRVHLADDLSAVTANPALSKVGEALDCVRRRAFELAQARGSAPGRELDDWLQAEKDLFFAPHAEVNESEDGFRMMISAAGFDTTDIEIVAMPQGVLVEAKTERRLEPRRDSLRAGGLESKTLYRRFDFPFPIEPGKVTARIDEGCLSIDAPKRPLERLPARAAAA
jgi:HSP20 family molecular chaperone IbpA